MTTDELRSLFLEFFISRNHTLVASDSLVPTYDPSLLFSGAGMNQFKDEFLGRGKRPLKRACSSQKCIRTGDIDNVGVTAGHHSFFEMLGNFSFGDYFKKDAIRWAWEFYTGVLRLPEEKLSVSVYQDDGEAFEIWHREVGLSESKIARLGAHDNFWPADAPTESPKGQLCGPCSEIYYDLGPTEHCPGKSGPVDCDCRRYVEIWNLVFQQFEKGGKPGELRELPQKNIDTGAGLERNAAVIQGVSTNFEIDILLPLVEEVLGIADAATGQKYAARYAEGRKRREAAGELVPVLRRARRIADHARAVTFCLSDGVLPSNEGRGYVVRRLLRRAVLDGRALGIREGFVHGLVAPVARIMGGQYPEVAERRENLARLVRAEEDNFRETIERGVGILREKAAAARGAGKNALDGRDAFLLHDTYGFPVEITEEMLREEGLSLDRAGFDAAMEEQREKARAGSKMIGLDIFGGVMSKVKGLTRGTEFVRQWRDGDRAKVMAIIREEQLVESAGNMDEVQVVLDRTPLYGESGGQVGDRGVLEAAGGRLEVADALRADEIFLHVGKVAGGTLRVGDQVTPHVDMDRRRAIASNHTATHILHHYLREVLGGHVEQAGSLVDPDRLRLDFTHFEGVKAEDLRRVEELVNRAISSGGRVETRETTVDEARRAGAMALFGEKYGEKVRMVTTDLGGGARSIELCGGTHLDEVGRAGLFRIEKEESVAAGIRRITGTTGAAALANAEADRAALGCVAALLGMGTPLDAKADPTGTLSRDRLDELCALLKAQRNALVERIKDLAARAGAGAKGLQGSEADRVKALMKLAKEAEKREQSSRASSLAGRGKEIAAEAGELAPGVLFAGAALDGLNPNDLRRLADEVRAALTSGVIFLASAFDGKAALVASVSDDLVKRGIKAGDIVKAAAAKVGGGGGGKPNMAQAGGSQPENIPAAIEAAAETIRNRAGG